MRRGLRMRQVPGRRPHSPSRGIPTTTARNTRSSSRSIISSAMAGT